MMFAFVAQLFPYIQPTAYTNKKLNIVFTAFVYIYKKGVCTVRALDWQLLLFTGLTMAKEYWIYYGMPRIQIYLINNDKKT